MTEKETIPGAFKALITGYGIVGFDYAYIPATSVPEFSLKGDKPFTIFTTVCFKNTQNGSILEQQDVFQMGIMDGILSNAKHPTKERRKRNYVSDSEET